MLQRNESTRYANVQMQTDIRRSHFPESGQQIRTWGTGNAGILYPSLYPLEVLPGDTFSMKSGRLCYLETPIVPTMDTALIDTYAFFVPMTALWDHTKQFFGESSVAGYEDVEYTIPMVDVVDNYSEDKGYSQLSRSLVDCFGLPIATKVQGHLNYKVSALPFRAYHLIWNNFFRDQNLQDAYPVSKGDTQESTLEFLYPRRVCKFHDYFTSCLPYVQKGPEVLMPGFNSDSTPIYFGDSLLGDFTVEDGYQASQALNSEFLRRHYPYIFEDSWLDSYAPYRSVWLAYGEDNASSQMSDKMIIQSAAAGGYHTFQPNGVIKAYADHVGFDQSVGYSTTFGAVPTNWYADLSAISNVTVLALRKAMAMQEFYENQALHGTRYYEYLRGSFGVVAPALNLDLPEYLGGQRSTVDIERVTDYSGEKLGEYGASSVTSIANEDFTKTFTQHGYIIMLHVFRTKQSYQQGIMKLWKRKNLFDFYQREFANLGEEPVYKYEIFADTNTLLEDPVTGEPPIFGYNERYASYRYFPDIVTGEFRSGVGASLDEYHYASYFSEPPTLSPEFIEAEEKLIDRTLKSDSSTGNQFRWQFIFQFSMDRKMPLFGGHSFQGWM